MLNLKSCPTEEEIIELLEERLLSIKRFRSTLTTIGSNLVFQEVDKVDWDYHVYKIFEDTKPSEEDVLVFLEDIVSIGFDMEKPLWRCIVVPELDDGSSKIITVFSHAIADGVASVGVLLKIIDDSPVDPTKPIKDQNIKTESIVVKRKKVATMSNWQKTKTFLSGVSQALSSPFDSGDKDNIFRLKVDIMDEKAYSGKKKFGRAANIPLKDIKDMKDDLNGATVNVILLALLTMTVKSYLLEKEDPILKDKLKLRGNFPISMRSENEALLKDGDTHNNVQALAFEFPLDYEDAKNCVAKVKEIIDEKKVSPELYIINSVSALLMNTLPAKLGLAAALKMATKASMMLSNVPGPQQLCHLAGIPIQDISFYLVAPTGTYLGVLSYNGTVTLTANFDETLGIVPDEFLKHWETSFDALKKNIEE